VIRLRSASWRSRASKSSGSFSVVRFMVCQHTAPHSDSSVSRSAGAHRPTVTLGTSAGLWTFPRRDIQNALDPAVVALVLQLVRENPRQGVFV
jgi:hypothetical protein